MVRSSSRSSKSRSKSPRSSIYNGSEHKSNAGGIVPIGKLNMSRQPDEKNVSVTEEQPTDNEQRELGTQKKALHNVPYQSEGKQDPSLIESKKAKKQVKI